MDSDKARQPKFSTAQLVMVGAFAVLATVALVVLFKTLSATTTECCGNSPAGFRSDAILPLDAGSPTPIANNCKKSKAQLPASGVRPLCATSDLVGPTSNPCVITGLKAVGCACYEGQAHACDPTTGGPCTTGVNCGIRACIVTSDTSSTWSGCVCM